MQTFTFSRNFKRRFLSLPCLFLYLSSLLGCGLEHAYSEFSVPVSSGAISWGMSHGEFSSTMERAGFHSFDDPPEDQKYRFDFSAPLETIFGISKTSSFIFEEDMLMAVKFVYEGTTAEELEKSLIQKYGEMTSRNYGIAPDQVMIPELGKIYAPVKAQIANLKEEDYQKIKRILSSQKQQPSYSVGGMTMSQQDAEKAAEEQLKTSSFFNMRVAEFSDEKTDNREVVLEITATYLSMLMGEVFDRY